jgi:sulfatase modifying factor 1
MIHQIFEPYIMPQLPRQTSSDKFGVFMDIAVGESIQRFRKIFPGTFLMSGFRSYEKVTISEPFWIGDTPVTQEFWIKITGENPSSFENDRSPVDKVLWEDCADFCSKLQSLFPGLIFRLPTEAEWEYACRAGTTGATYAEALGCGIDDIAWHHENSNGQIHPVKQKLPNPWGLYDMLGNVWERCHNLRPVGSLTARSQRVIRGGSYQNHSWYVDAECRNSNHLDIRFMSQGLRLIIE